VAERIALAAETAAVRRCDHANPGRRQLEYLGEPVHVVRVCVEVHSVSLPSGRASTARARRAAPSQCVLPSKKKRSSRTRSPSASFVGVAELEIDQLVELPLSP